MWGKIIFGAALGIGASAAIERLSDGKVNVTTKTNDGIDKAVAFAKKKYEERKAKTSQKQETSNLSNESTTPKKEDDEVDE